MRTYQHPTSNIEHPTSNDLSAEVRELVRVFERLGDAGGNDKSKKAKMKRQKHPTSNIEHPTSNGLSLDVMEFNEGEGQNRKFDLEERLLEFASAIIDLSEKLPESRAGNHVAGQVLQS